MATDATRTLATASFSPTGSAQLVLCVRVFIGMVGCDVTVADSLTGSGAWAQVATVTSAPYGGYTMRTSIWKMTMGASPGSGTVTVTRTAGNTDYAYFMDVLEVTGASTTIGLTATAGPTVATSLATDLGSAPASTSAVICMVGVESDAADSTHPTGYTEDYDQQLPFNDEMSVAYKVGSPGQTQTWTTLDVASTGATVLACELTEVGGAATVKPRNLMMTGMGQ